MARRAKFGRQVRVQPNITATLVSIAREQVAREDSNIMDAWKNGGEFEGKKVTDEMVLKYWDDRQENLDKNDPLYDTYNNQISQLQYAVQQSEMDLKHIQGKVSDSEYANFFLKWSKKAPRNSEWWRTLQKDAAQLLASAKAKSAANANANKVKAFNAFVAQQNKDIDVGVYLTQAIDNIARESGLDLEGNSDRVLDLLNQDMKNNPGKYRLLTDALGNQNSVPEFVTDEGDTAARGRKVTVGRETATTFQGTITAAFVQAAVTASTNAYSKVATRADKDGFASAYAQAGKGQADQSQWGEQMKIWPVAKSYDSAYQLFAQTWGNQNASLMDKKAAAERFAGAISLLAKRDDLDTVQAAMLLADAKRAMGEDAGEVPSFGSTVLGGAGIDQNVQVVSAYATQQQTLMDQNPGAYVYAPVGEGGAYDSTGRGPVGIVPAGQVPSDAQFVAVPGMGGKARMVAYQPKAVLVQDPNDPDAPPTVAGYAIQYPVGSTTVSLYGYTDNTGTKHWTDTNPWNSAAGMLPDKNGNLVITLPQSTNPMAKAQAIDAKYGTDLAKTLATLPAGAKTDAVVYQRDENGKVTAKLTVSYDGNGFSLKQTQQTYNPADGKLTDGSTTTIPLAINSEADLKAQALAPERYTGGNIPNVTFNSPAEASINASQSNLTNTQMQALANDPTFKFAFMSQTMKTLGIQDPNDPRIAAAWNSATAKTTSTPNFGGLAPDPGIAFRASEREDLNFPGVSKKGEEMGGGTPGITFAGQELRVPAIPMIGGTPVGTAGPSSISTAAGQMGDFASQFAFAGAGLGGAGLGAGVPMVTPTVTPVAGATVTATPTVATPTAAAPTTVAPGPAGISATKLKQLEGLNV